MFLLPGHKSNQDRAKNKTKQTNQQQQQNNSNQMKEKRACCQSTNRYGASETQMTSEWKETNQMGQML